MKKILVLIVLCVLFGSLLANSKEKEIIDLIPKKKRSLTC